MGKKLKDEVTKDWLFGFIKKEQRIEHMQKGGSLLLATPNVLERLGPATRSEGGSDGTRTHISRTSRLGAPRRTRAGRDPHALPVLDPWNRSATRVMAAECSFRSGERKVSSAATALARWPRHSSSCRSAAQLADLLYV